MKNAFILLQPTKTEINKRLVKTIPKREFSKTPPTTKNENTFMLKQGQAFLPSVPQVQGSRLKKKALLAAGKIRLLRKNYQIPLYVTRKASTKPTQSRHKKRWRHNWLYRWIYKGNKRILFRVKLRNLRNAALVKKKNISLSGQRKQGKRNHATIYIRSTYNNTIFTLSGGGGKTVCCIPTGTCGFKNTRKSTSYASQLAAQKIAMWVKKEKKITAVRIKMSGVGPGKFGGVKALGKAGVRISNIRECSSLPHNGCRPAKRRRL